MGEHRLVGRTGGGHVTKRPRLTPHQKAVLGDARRIWTVLQRPFPASQVGSIGAVRKLAEKGYLRTAVYSGPRNDEHLYIEEVVTR